MKLNNEREVLAEVLRLQDEVDSIRVELRKNDNRLKKVREGLDEFAEYMKEELSVVAVFD